MLYFANPSTRLVRDEMSNGPLGCIVTPGQGNRIPAGAPTCIDNGCGPGKDGRIGAGYPGDGAYLDMLARLADDLIPDYTDPDLTRCMFAVAPDVLGDAEATLERASRMFFWIRYLNFPVALVAQNGLEYLAVPWDDFDVLFIGGDTAWKLGPAARHLAGEAKRRGKWVHMGRVNSLKRLRYADAIGCDSADGTYLAFGPDKNLPVALGWIRDVNGQGALFDVLEVGA
jgi:hypothetical protein